jgi:hypothetical protein
MSTRVAGGRYRLALDGTGALTVRRGGRVVRREQLDPQVLVDLIDAIAAGPRAMDGDMVLARGTATIAGHPFPLTLARFGDSEPFRPLASAIDRAAGR